MSAQSLHLELTETSLMQDEKAAQRIVQHLEDLGVEIRLDDFGTGYSSLGFLRRFPMKSRLSPADEFKKYLATRASPQRLTKQSAGLNDV